MVDIFTDSCGTDVLEMSRQFQFHNGVLNHIIRCLISSALSGFSEENNMRECHNGIFFRFHPIRGRILHNITACHHINFFSREHFPQFFQVCRIGNIDGRIGREKENIFFVCHRHIQNTSAHSVRLSFFRPGKFIQCQINGKSKISDFPGNFLVTQSKGVECTREKGNFLRF